MGKSKKKWDPKKAKLIKQHWHKRGSASKMASNILLMLAAEDPKKGGYPKNTVAQPETGASTSNTKMPKPAVKPNGFKKIRDHKQKNAPKRLKHNANQKNALNREVISKLLSSIKKKYAAQKNPHIKRRLDFRRRESPAKNVVLPKPRFFNHKDDSIEEGELIEELESSDDDDCVLLETPNESIRILDDDDDEPSTSDQQPKEIVTDYKGEAALRIAPKTENPVLYSTIVKGDFSESIINLDESSEADPSPIVENNDSVIFIEDTTGEDFIPIPSYSPPLRRGKKRRSARIAEAPKQKTARMNDSLFTTAEKKKLGDYNTNTFNPTEEAGETSDKPKTSKRFIIIDGSNVAFAHGNSNVFSSEGIKYCLQYFEKMGHEVKAVIPMFRKNNFKSSNPELLDKLHKEGKIVFTPCKNIPGQMSSSYDDRFILQLAYEKNAAVVSNDNYRDLINENPAFKKIVENRVLGYSWCDNIFILPKDPYGRWGPTLDEILRC
ncbi:NEDD4-binding protein 1 isoform X1 [Drosophila santomea]|uniref:NEDD4-binding protein 1 isoform X1 n=2 Tax=Drosophila santomea TaxID=129105 RepID=UPI001953F86B|nr:NEDD4-binding protein 1 isoform X1 [Drosophila santomea]